MIPRWVVVAGIPAMVLVATAAVWLLLGLNADRDTLDAIRTGSALGIGLGGIVVLWLAIRRQRSTELTRRLAEHVATANESRRLA